MSFHSSTARREAFLKGELGLGLSACGYSVSCRTNVRIIMIGESKSKELAMGSEMDFNSHDD